jgi:HD-like signal output (HDOD) protein
VAELHATLERRLARVGLATQPEVASQILDLTSRPDAQITEYAKILRADQGLTGRLLRLANSAYFAQRQPVTTIERACVLLGLDRLKAVSLGFYLSAAASSDASNALSRRTWGQSVFRACVAGELAKVVSPRQLSESFVIGLMVDAGVPLMLRLVGDQYMKYAEAGVPPARTFRLEFQELEFTHVDVAAALCKRWRLPEVLAKPIEWHHTAPGESEKQDTLYRMHRIAYYCGQLDLDAATNQPKQQAPMATIAERTLGLTTEQLSKAVRDACGEYRGLSQMFSHVAQGIADLEELAASVNTQLAEVIERAVIRPGDSPDTRLEFTLGGMTIALEHDRTGPIAFLLGANGDLVASLRLCAEEATVEALREAFGLEPHEGDEVVRIRAQLGRMAA